MLSILQHSNVQSHLFAESSATCKKQDHVQEDAEGIASDINAVLQTWSFYICHMIRGGLIVSNTVTT